MTIIKRELFADFLQWTNKKVAHHCDVQKKEIYFREGQIWWVALGKNVGFEMNGKYEAFHRPVLIIKKYNEHMCFILPLTSQIKHPLPWYQKEIDIKGKKSAVVLSQGRTISIKRFLRRVTFINHDVLESIINAFQEQFILEKKGISQE